MKGTVKFFNSMRGFGFVEGEDGKEYFVHQTGLQEGVSLNENEAVEFEAEEGERGPKATNVRKDSGSSESASESTTETETSESDDSEE